MLDDINILKQHDVLQDLEIASREYEQTAVECVVQNSPKNDTEIANIIITGVGGSGLASSAAQIWLESDLKVPFEVRRTYTLPNYVNEKTLVIACSYSGNTEETLSGAQYALSVGANLAVISAGGKLIELAHEKSLPMVELYRDESAPNQPRMAMISQLKAIVNLLIDYGLLPSEKDNEIASLRDWLKSEVDKWSPDVSTSDNLAKQLAHIVVGKTAAFYSGHLSSPAAYKLKVCCNETAKNVAFWNQFPEFSHNEMMGWTSHPIEKPFAVFDVISKFDDPQILKRFEITDKLLSGNRPHATRIELAGDTLLGEILWGSLLADFLNIYLAALNNVNPIDVGLVEKLKKEL